MKSFDLVSVLRLNFNDVLYCIYKFIFDLFVKFDYMYMSLLIRICQHQIRCLKRLCSPWTRPSRHCTVPPQFSKKNSGEYIPLTHLKVSNDRENEVDCLHVHVFTKSSWPLWLPELTDCVTQSAGLLSSRARDGGRTLSWLGPGRPPWAQILKMRKANTTLKQ